jgi:hypothetical protein
MQGGAVDDDFGAAVHDLFTVPRILYQEIKLFAIDNIFANYVCEV